MPNKRVIYCDTCDVKGVNSKWSLIQIAETCWMSIQNDCGLEKRMVRKSSRDKWNEKSLESWNVVEAKGVINDSRNGSRSRARADNGYAGGIEVICTITLKQMEKKKEGSGWN